MANQNAQGKTNGTDIHVVTPQNMGEGLSYDPKKKQYYIAVDERLFELDELGRLRLRLSAVEDNILKLKGDGLYLGTKPTRGSFYVDYENGDDSNDGSRERPFKHIVTALRAIETNTVGTVIYLKEAQTHRLFSDSERKGYNHVVNASYIICPYGEQVEELAKRWNPNRDNPEPYYHSQEYVDRQLYPTVALRGSTTQLENDKPYTFLEHFNVRADTTAGFWGLRFIAEDTAMVSNSSNGWFTAVVRGAGSVIFTGCIIEQRDTERGHFYLANSTIGELSVLCQCLTAKGTGNLWSVGQYPMRAYSSYERTGQVEPRSQGNMRYVTSTSADEIFRLTTNTNPKSFINNK